MSKLDMRMLAPNPAPRPKATALTVDYEIRAAQRMVDVGFKRLLAQHAAECRSIGKEPLKLGCKRGCAGCCTYAVSAAESEAHLLASTVQRMPADRRAAVLARLFAWDRDWRRFMETQPPIESSADERRQSGRWGIRRAACPFLDMTDHSCGVYADRPMMCRTHHAAYPPPDWMDVPNNDDDPRPPREPGDGCLTTDEDMASDGVAPIWQIDHVHVPALGEAVKISNRHGLGHGITTEPMPLRVLAFGRVRFGWQPPDELPDTPTIDRAVLP